MRLLLTESRTFRPRKDVRDHHVQSLPFTGEEPEIWRHGPSGSYACLYQKAWMLSSVVVFCVSSLGSSFVEAIFADLVSQGPDASSP